MEPHHVPGEADPAVRPVRALPTGAVGALPGGLLGHAAPGMWEVIHYVYQNFKEDITLEMLAERFSYSVPYISVAFKQAVGENYYSFLERNRTAHACNLLIGTDMKITDVAYEAGFKSYPTFVRVFQARMGMSPTAYRKREYIALT